MLLLCYCKVFAKQLNRWLQDWCSRVKKVDLNNEKEKKPVQLPYYCAVSIVCVGQELYFLSTKANNYLLCFTVSSVLGKNCSKNGVIISQIQRQARAERERLGKDWSPTFFR